MSDRITFDIKKRYGVIGSSIFGDDEWKKELNLVSWNDGDYKYDIRSWSPDYEKMTRGITLNEEQMDMFYKLLPCVEETDLSSLPNQNPSELKGGEVYYEIKKHFGIISTFGNKWTMELNLVNWNGKDKYDIRSWSPDHEKMTRGITFSQDEFDLLSNLIKQLKEKTISRANENLALL